MKINNNIINTDINSELELSYRKSMQVLTFKIYWNNNCYPLCPRCNQCLSREYLNYCYHCGQKLSWKHFSYKNRKK